MLTFKKIPYTALKEFKYNFFKTSQILDKWQQKQAFGLVLWHINHYRSFNAKSFLYLYIKYMICKHIL